MFPLLIKWNPCNIRSDSMIQIDKNKKMIYFYPIQHEFYNHFKNNGPFDNTDENKLMKCSLNLISGYICPDCNMILAAYYIGNPSVNPVNYIESLTNDLDYFEPEISKTSYYSNNSKNTGYIKLNRDVHAPKNCPSFVSYIKGYTEPIYEFLKPLNKSEIPSDEQIKTFSESVLNNEIPGIEYIHDICNNDFPLLKINSKKFHMTTTTVRGNCNYGVISRPGGKKLASLIKHLC